MQRSSVVFPEPLGPMIATFWLLGTARSIPHRTSVSPNRLCRSTIFSNGSMNRPRLVSGTLLLSPRLAGARPALAGRALTGSIRLQAVGSVRRLPAGVAVDTDPRIGVGRREPRGVAKPVPRHDLDVLAIGPDLADLGVQ